MVNNLLLREDFFTDDNLMHWFGGEAIEWVNKPLSVHKSGRIKLINNKHKYGNLDMEFSFYKIDENNKLHDKGKIEASLYMGISHEIGLLDLSDIRNIYGLETTSRYWYDSPSYRNGHGAPITRATHAMGNKVISYQLSSPQTDFIRFFVRFSYDGKPIRINVIVKEK